MRVLTLLVSIIASGAVTAYGNESFRQVNTMQDARAEYNRCMVESTFGMPGCGAESCLGFLRSQENKGKNDKCFIPLPNGGCLFGKKGHGGSLSSEWAQYEYNHRANFKTCFDRAEQLKSNAGIMIGANVTASNPISAASTADAGGAQGALSGESSGDYADDYEMFGIKKSDALDRMMKGESLADIIASSDYGQKMKSEELDSLKDFLNNPADQLNTLKEEIAANGDGSAEGGANANSEEDPLASLFDNGEGGPDGPLTMRAATGEKDKNKNAKASGIDEKNGGRSPASLAELEQKKYGSHNGYEGRTIFQMVSSQYRKEMKHLLLFDHYLKQSKTKAPSDAKAFLEASQPVLF